MPIDEDILRSIRRITRAIELHSRRLQNTFGLTGPQLVCLRAIGQKGPLTVSALAEEVALSNATLTGIIDRLVARQLVSRERGARDRRLVQVSVTAAGRALVAQAPSPLQEQFVQRLTALPDAEQQRIRDTLDQMVHMMGSERIEAAPILSTAPAQSAEEVQCILDQDKAAAELEQMTDELALAVDGERAKETPPGAG